MKHFADTGDAPYAAEKAGYASPAVSGSQLSRRPAIVEAARAKALEELAGTILPLAVKRHVEILRDAPIGQALNSAIKLAYQYGLGDGANKPTKEPHEMTAAELAEAIATLKRAAADKAKPVIEARAVEEPGGIFD